jgi:hypothetical protein
VTSLFVPDGDRFVPTELTRGPWDPAAQHGGPPSALAARALEQVFGSSMAVVRVTVELMRPVPLAPLDLRAQIVRPGRKVQLAEASIVVAGTGMEVLRARALAVRTTDLGLDEVVVEEPLPPAIGSGVPMAPLFEQPAGAPDAPVAFHSHGVDRVVVEGPGRDGAASVWIRLRQPLIEGEEPTGVQRAVAAADFGNGVSPVLPPDRFVFINPDLTVHLLRAPVGDAVCLRSITLPGPAGAGLAESALFDVAGRVGRSCQSLFLDRR